MSLPEFNLRGTLDKGVHVCKSDEFFERFCYGNNTIRSNYKEVLEQMFAFALNRNASSVIIGGSFITNKPDPNDLDCILIVPNEECCNFQTNELLDMDGCELDIIIINESRKDTIYAFLNMLSKDRYSLDVGMVEVILDKDKDKSTWDDYDDYYSVEALLMAREAYINRHIIRGVKKKKILVTVCNAEKFLMWNYEIAPIVSSSGWIFAPYLYRNDCDVENELQRFKGWISLMYCTYESDLCVYADEMGTFLLGRYMVDVMKVSEEELLLLTEEPDYEKAALKILKQGPRIVAVTLGEKGAMIATQQHCETVKATPVEKIIDTTGAGDCFWGGFLSKYLKYGKGIEVLSWEEIMQCAVMGNSVAGLCVQKRGGIPSVPNKEELSDIWSA